jgi:hypothetical protein
LGALFWYKNTNEFLSTAIIAEGKVIELVYSSNHAYSPVVEFETKSGSLVEFEFSSGTNPPSYTRGEKVKVFYQESRLENARINSWSSLWAGPIFLTIPGSLVSLIVYAIAAGKAKRIKY